MKSLFKVADTSRLWALSLKLKKEIVRFNLLKLTFSQRVVNMWNGLPTASTMRAFKNQQEAHLTNIIGIVEKHAPY